MTLTEDERTAILAAADNAQADADIMRAGWLYDSDAKAECERLTALAADLRRLHADLSRDADEDDAPRLQLSDIRKAIGDTGQMMQSELVECIRGLRKDAERYRWMRNHQPESLQGGELVEASEDPFIAAHLVDKWGDVYELIGDDLDKEIDAAMAKEASDA